ncbi:pumilio/PUF RNA binding protein 2 [Trypanosoma rangeli SC58]|uniref:Pumilio/PUF RNA binding protein 2 n=1 Tax=Trypanosoma rangeli SC58 TaxID=429131 RepID=A0A061JAP9_TRYRA|nr:pumilio/PUF RNA binding protein 2 [Trypanosoma rangeli SC58]
MSDWDNVGSSVIGEGNTSGDAKNAVEVDWFSNNHDIFSGGGETVLVDPRDVKRAETAPSVLTMYSADGTLCVGGSLEEVVPPEEEYRYTEEYHVLYYSKYPRDPRMLVPLRSSGGVRRGGESGLPGHRGVTGNQKIFQESENVTDSHEVTADNVQEREENAQDSSDMETAYSKGVLESLSKNQQTHQQEQENRQRYEADPSFSSMEADEAPSDAPMDGSLNIPATTRGSLQSQINNEVTSTGRGQPQAGSTPRSLRRGSAAARRGTLHNHQASQNGGVKNNARRQANGGALGSFGASANELSSVREYLEEVSHECSYNAIQGRVVALSKDQEGSRFVQRLLEEDQNVISIFKEVYPSTCELMIHVFGNYVLQKLLDVLPAQSDVFEQLFEKVSGRLKEYSFHTYGCRVIQRFLVKASSEIRESILFELKDCMVDCVFDQNASHVAQKIIEVMPEKTQFMTEAFLPNLKVLPCHPYGCRVLQCIFEKCSSVPEVNIRPLFEAVLEHAHEYVMDQYGNYVVQHAVLNAPEDLRKRFVEFLIPHVYALSCSKFASNVAEKTIVKANKEELQQIVDILTRPSGGAEDGSCLVLMMQDPYANYVVQRLLQEVTRQQQQHIAEQTRRHLTSIRRSVYGQHLVQKMENMGMFSWMEGDMCNNSVYHEQAALECASNRKARGVMGIRKASRGVSAPQSAYVTSMEPSLAAASSYRQPGAPVAVAGRTMLPLAPTGSGYSYGYLDFSSDALLAPSQQLQQTQHHLMSVPSVTIGVQSCYPGMIPPAPPPQAAHSQQCQYPPRQVFALQGQHGSYNMMDSASMPEHQHPMSQTNPVSATNQIDADSGARVGQSQGSKWTNMYQTLNPSVQQTMPCGVSTPNLYPGMNTASGFWKWGCDPVLALSSSLGQQLRLI